MESRINTKKHQYSNFDQGIKETAKNEPDDSGDYR